MEKVCKERLWAESYDFGASQFSMQPPIVKLPQAPISLETHQSDVYDPESIMHYDTRAFTGPAYWSDHFQGPLLAWKNGGPNFVPPAQVTKDDLKVIYTNHKPSVMDGEAIRKLYPWTS
jgi:hypothetical protein